MINIPPGIIRQPPAPPSRTPREHCLSIAADEKEEDENTGVVGRNYLRRCNLKRLRLMKIKDLPSEVWLEILAQLPAQDVYEVGRLVCWKWYRLIYDRYFIYANLQHTNYGLLFKCGDVARFMTVQRGQIEISKLSYEFKFCPYVSCNGLTLQLSRYPNSDIYVTNPVTKQVFVLPRNPSRVQLFHHGIAYVAASMEYKVVATYLPTRNPRACAILTVGVDKSWRRIETQHLPSPGHFSLVSTPLINEGFIHWARGGEQRKRDGRLVLTLNVETETITATSPPVPHAYGRNWTYLSTGMCLSLLIKCGEVLLWQVWEMKPETGEWRKLPDIDLEAQKWRFGLKPNPLGWLNYPEVLALGADNQCILFYSIVTKEIHTFKLPLPRYSKPILHKNSLVWLSGS